MTATIDDVAQTLAEYERLAITSGAMVQIGAPEYSGDGVTFAPLWFAATPPVGGRVTVHRDGVPTEFYASWDESLPIETSTRDDGRLWREVWVEKPMQRFGSFLIRSALRRAFREVIGDRHEPDEEPGDPWAPAVDRDWDSEIATAGTEDEVLKLHAVMKKARVITPEREVALRARLKAARDIDAGERLAAGLPVDDDAAASIDEPTPELSTEERIRHDAFFRAEDEASIAPGRPAPQDHLPSNRAARRASAKRKGRRK